MSADNAFEGWAIVELMGHRKLAGRVSEATVAGEPLMRLDVPAGDAFLTQYYGAKSIYCLTPADEAICRRFARAHQIEPVHAYELAPPLTFGEAVDQENRRAGLPVGAEGFDIGGKDPHEHPHDGQDDDDDDLEPRF